MSGNSKAQQSIQDLAYGAYGDHRSTHYGDEPKIVIMHPTTYQEAMQTANQGLMFQRDPETGQLNLYGVKVIRSLDIKTHEILCF